eukprot:gnl/TRDRNA2_/TRDRNA2_139253_c0_seq1.p1 gnl/TRDRNA2_/TRDRNA2_139253_c0~~gnl/TRDRNA2_/TRDRNA2_139253_c0_seq1.p1  ORF type:complete len:366 (-),score=47.70 gnl/TRDRNA2_/TRDRNA2_139253_c0_seq1:340-1437(-)
MGGIACIGFAFTTAAIASASPYDTVARASSTTHRGEYRTRNELRREELIAGRADRSRADRPRKDNSRGRRYRSVDNRREDDSRDERRNCHRRRDLERETAAASEWNALMKGEHKTDDHPSSAARSRDDCPRVPGRGPDDSLKEDGSETENWDGSFYSDVKQGQSGYKMAELVRKGKKKRDDRIRREQERLVPTTTTRAPKPSEELDQLLSPKEQLKARVKAIDARSNSVASEEELNPDLAAAVAASRAAYAAQKQAEEEDAEKPPTAFMKAAWAAKQEAYKVSNALQKQQEDALRAEGKSMKDNGWGETYKSWKDWRGWYVQTAVIIHIPAIALIGSAASFAKLCFDHGEHSNGLLIGRAPLIAT